MDQRDRDVLGARRQGATETFSRTLRRLALALAVFAVALLASPRHAAAENVRLVATGVEATPGRYAPAASSQDEEIRRRGAEIDRTVAEALEDMGLTVETVSDNAASDGDLHAIARGDWAVAPRFELRPGGALVRIVAVSPGARVLLLREEDLEGSELGALSVRTVVMVRDIVESGRQKTTRPAPTRPSRVHRTPPPPRSSGRAVLALNAAVYGGYFGFTVQRAGGEPDSRLVYPMVALGAGLGVGASLLVADEWDISHGDAWYLAAGAYWPGASGYLVAQSYGKQRKDQYLYGLVGATTGIGLGTVALATGDVGEGGAVLTHSGGAFGMLFGAMTQVAIEGSTEMSPPTRGMGIGTGLGVVAAGATATQVDISSSRMLLLDLSVSLGGLSGAALASPLLFLEGADETHTRLWLGAAFAGAVAGGVIGWYVSDSWDTPRSEGLRIFPYAHHVPSPRGDTSEVGVMGTF